MPDRSVIHELNSEQTNLARTGVSDASNAATIVVAGDTLAPSSPTSVTANSVPDGVKLEWLNPSLNEDGTTCVDQRWSKIYYSTSTPVTTSDSSYVTAARAATNSAFVDSNVGTSTTMYYAISSLDGSGNESSLSAEVSAKGGGANPNTDIPDDCSGLVFDDTIGTEGVVIGDGILGIAFKNPASTWISFDHYRLWFDVDAGGGFADSWTEITPVNRIGYLHKGLTKTYSYRYKATIVGADGTESSTPDKSKADDSGHTPNGGNNDLIVAELLFAENIVATNEVRGEHFFAESFLAINDKTWQNQGIQLEYNAGTPRAYIGDGGVTVTDKYIMHDGTNLSWRGENTYLTAAGEFGASNAVITGAITASSGSIGGFTIGASALTAGSGATAVGIAPGSYPFYAGSETAASAPFRVTDAGVLYAAGATITNTTISGTSTWTGNSIATTYTAAKCTDANADQTSANTAAAISGQGNLATRDTVGTGQIDTTVISGGKIITGLLTASNIQTGTLNASLITVSNLSASSITTGTLNFSSISRSSLSVIESELATNSVSNAKIQANAVHVAEMYIDDDLNFAGDATHHKITNLDAIQFLGTSGYPRIISTSDSLAMNVSSGCRFILDDSAGIDLIGVNGDINIYNVGADDILLTSGDDIVLSAGGEIDFIGTDLGSISYLNGPDQSLYVKHNGVVKRLGLWDV